jgi:hypothetical protein
MHKHFNKSLQSLVAFPVLAANLALNPFSGVSVGSPTAAVISPESNRPLSSLITVNQHVGLDEKANKIDKYFADRNLPMAGQGKTLAAAAEKNDLPWSLVASIAYNESTAGKFACPKDPNNVFGWNSCRGEKFDSMEDAIYTVAESISAHRETTARYYKGKTLQDIIETYNGRANPLYYKKIMWVMNQIEQQPIAIISSDTKA